MIKVLNLYSGIGGNRKLWTDVDVTAVEHNTDIAKIYQDFFPNDKMVIADAHQYLLDHYKEYDFIWSSPPCPSHSEMRRCGVYRGQYEAIYPDMSLYQEIILLNYFHKKGSFYCVENVKPYYDLLIPGQQIDRHIFWSNFYIQDFKAPSKHMETINNQQNITGFDLSKYKNIGRRDMILRRCVQPELGKHIFDCAFKNIQLSLI